MADEDDTQMLQALVLIQDSFNEHSKMMSTKFDGMETQIFEIRDSMKDHTTEIKECLAGSISNPDGLMQRVGKVEDGQVDIKKRLDDHDKIEQNRLHNTSTNVPIAPARVHPQPHPPIISAKEGGVIATVVTGFTAAIYALIQFFKSHHGGG